MDRVGIIITSRVQSRRLPSKAIRRIGNRTALEILIDNLQRQIKYQIVLAIPKSPDCDILEEIGTNKNVLIHRGQDGSPLHRITEAARKFGFDHVVRITQDDILIDAQQMCNQVHHHLKWGCDYTWISAIPEGCAGEVISVSALNRIVEEVGSRDVEFISYYLRREEFKQREYLTPFEYQFPFRLTMDYEEDLALIRAVFAQLAFPVGTLDIINLLKNPRNRHLLEINRLPEITVYTCCYNQGKYIVQCLDSIAAQDFEDFDLLIIDDCSTDDTPHRIAEWISRQPEQIRKRVRVERWAENIGLPASANRAVHYARGKYLVRVDSDDYIDPSFLGVMHGRIKAEKSSGAVFCSYHKVDESGTFLSEHKGNEEYHPGCAMYRTGYVKDIMYREDLKHYEGLEFWKRFSRHFSAVFISDVLWFYRQHGESKSASDPAEREAVRLSI